MAIIPLLLSSIGISQFNRWESWILENPQTGLYLFCLISIFSMGLALTPTTFVAILGGFLFDWNAFFLLLMSYSLAAVLGRYLGMLWFRLWKTDLTQKAPHYQRFLSSLSQNPFWPLVTARLSPLLPFAMTNLLIGQIQIKWPTYLGATLLGMLPRTLLSFWAGRQINDIRSYFLSPDPLPMEKWVILALLLLSTAGLIVLLGRIWKASQIGK